jgi:hypothetical protein
MKPIINDYVFYKITCEDLPEYIYIGSTVHFIKRKCQHKGSCNNSDRKNHNLKLYQTIRDNGGWDKWNMLVIDEAKQVTLTEARIKEESLRKEYNGNLNMVKAHVTVEEIKECMKKKSKEHYEKNKEDITEKHKEYRESNKEIIFEKQKEYYKKNKEIIFEKRKKYRELNKELISEKKKVCYESNKEVILEKRKEYYETNKESINEKRKEKITCECGSIFNKRALNRHINSLKHQQFCQPIDLSI